ncbi:expressed unknown protein [Seminavis robusta]|uniref:Uncharacterized protein n=1 Tax=Seminavis robusta TaxID=568900 RepID=A0A9N8DQA9_9STRA|nr:expressed unknown protein [Seminavis robusta]|eukprot:Sro270_g104300.1 n/a (97) ;mRNA; f:59960-60250
MIHEMQGKAAILPVTLATLHPTASGGSTSCPVPKMKPPQKAEQNALIIEALRSREATGRGADNGSKRKWPCSSLVDGLRDSRPTAPFQKYSGLRDY